MDNTTVHRSQGVEVSTRMKRKGDTTAWPKSRERIADGFAKQQMIVLPGPVVKEALTKPVTMAVLPTDIGVFDSASCHYIHRPIGVRQAILIYCVRGEGWAEINGGRSAVRAGNILVVPPGQPHAYGAAENHPWTIYWCHVAGTNVLHLLTAIGMQPSGPTVISGNPRVLVPLFEKVIGTLTAGYNRRSLLTASLAMGHLFGELIAQHGTSAIRDDVEERLEASIEFLRQQVAGSVRVNELAAMSRFSPSHFAVLFKQKTGYAVLDFFIRLKMQEACRLLDMTNLAIKAIADRVGYDDSLYFSRAFTKVMAMPPRDYRALRKG